MRRINKYEKAKRAGYRGKAHAQSIATGNNGDALLKAKENTINQAIIGAFEKSFDLRIEHELRQAIHQS